VHSSTLKFTNGRCDMHMLSILYDYCSISLFAETVLLVGQVPMLHSLVLNATQDVLQCEDALEMNQY